MKDYEKMFDDAKTMVEHERIIMTYRSTGKLDREDAIEKYKDFNRSHPEYIAGVNIQGAVLHNVLPMENLNDFDIVRNLQLQLLYRNRSIIPRLAKSRRMWDNRRKGDK